MPFLSLWIDLSYHLLLWSIIKHSKQGEEIQYIYQVYCFILKVWFSNWMCASNNRVKLSSKRYSVILSLVYQYILHNHLVNMKFTIVVRSSFYLKLLNKYFFYEMTSKCFWNTFKNVWCITKRILKLN